MRGNDAGQGRFYPRKGFKTEVVVVLDRVLNIWVSVGPISNCPKPHEFLLGVHLILGL